ncbi:SDR family NAD(P)-dependent oxidoreductase [Enterovirga sp. CN4-39]|uniref:SDR family NAD(P)-dependent oxidoreductase n=1 Tax=Enterovirga sp. CN4-39 TaxID=3400910 RepID=UPI003C1042FF
MKLDGLHGVVTGAGSGLGRAIAASFAREGARLTLIDRHAESLEETCALLGSTAACPICSTTDVTRSTELSDEIRRAAGVQGPLRIVVNCAGIIVRKGFLETSEEEWHRILDVNVVGYVNVLRAAIPLMSEGGSIIQIASSNAHRGGHGFASYAASKGAVLSMTRHLAGELAPLRIRINSLSPGPTLTALNYDLFSDQEATKAVTGAIPLARLGKVEDVVGAAVFLASSDSDYVSGADLAIDGGLISQIALAAGGKGYYGRSS